MNDRGSLNSDGTIVIVGASTAGLAAAETLRAGGFGGRLVLADKERERPYYRPALTKEFLTGDFSADEIVTLSDTRKDQLNIELMLGTQASFLDSSHRMITLGGERITYDGVVVATGARARSSAAFGSLSGFYTLRTIDDARQVAHEMATKKPRVVVVGGGFLGCEVAAAACSYGLSVSLIESESRLLQRVLPDDLAKPLVQLHQVHGVAVLCGRPVISLLGNTQVEAVELSDGTVIDADLVIVGVGTVPETEWLEGSAVRLDGGILTSSSLRTTAENVYAAGDVVRWATGAGNYSQRSEHWAAARAQGQLAARNLLAGSEQPYVHAAYGWSDQYDRQFQTVGSFGLRLELVVRDELGGSYVAMSGDHDVVTGAVALDNRKAFNRARSMVANRTSWRDCLAEDWRRF